ncbi:hypothetical protein COOONC_26812 [Cooperia oncophora]
MEFSFTDVPVSDPFLSLETNLEDISVYEHSQYRRISIAPPQDYYDPNRNREIGSIVSLLQSHSPPSSDPYAAMKFSPPNFDSSLNGGGPASMLPKLGPPTVPPLQLNHYQPSSLVSCPYFYGLTFYYFLPHHSFHLEGSK